MRRGVLIFWGIFIAAAVFRVAQSFNIRSPDIGQCLKETIQGVGVIENEPERKETGQIFIISADEFHTSSSTAPASNFSCGGDILIRVKTKLYPRFTYADRVTFTGKLSKPFNFRSGDGRSFDYKGYLAKDDVFYEIKSATVELVASGKSQVTSNGDGSLLNWVESLPEKISAILFSLKRSFVGNLERALGEPHAALAAGLVVGEKAALGSDLLNDFRIVGLIHIVVLSGYNITIVAVALRRILSFLPRVWGLIIGGLGIILFGILVGGGATVVRSCFMAGIALSADLIRRDYSVVRALALAGLIMLIQNPMILLHDPSFQLSFLATLGLILLASPIEKRFQFIPEKFGMRGTVASTIATQLFVSPYILYMMGQISIIGMVVNILVLPFIPATMLFVFLTGATGMIFFPLAQCIGWIAHLFLSYELFMVQNFARVPFASAHVPVFPFWFVVAFYVIFALLFLSKDRIRIFRTAVISKIARKNIARTSDELRRVKDSGSLFRPHRSLFLARMSKDIAHKTEIKHRRVFISQRSIKHILERRGSKAAIVIGELTHVIKRPTKVVSNSGKRKNSFLFIRSAEVTVAAVIETTERPGGCQVVSAFLMDQKTYEKLTDISGRAESPPFELPS